METIGKKIRKCRLRKDLTQKEIWYALKISKSAYSNIETDKVDITVSRLRKIALLLKVNYIELLPFTPDDIYPPPKYRIKDYVNKINVNYSCKSYIPSSTSGNRKDCRKNKKWKG